MRLDDIRSPGMLTNSHDLRKAVVRAISFCEVLGSSEKAVELQMFFRDAIAYLDEKIVSTGLPESEKPTVDPAAVSPFEDDDIEDEIPDSVFPVKPAPKKVVGKPAVKGKAK